MEFGEVVTGAREVADEQIVAPLKKVVRIATEEDVRRAEYNEKRETEAFRICQEKVAKHKLEMKLVSVEYTFDNSKIIFYFTANGRVDFRELVKDLAGVFKMRIELRQIGVRDEAKMLGGLGSCGRPICCGTFLGDFQPVSIRWPRSRTFPSTPRRSPASAAASCVASNMSRTTIPDAQEIAQGGQGHRYAGRRGRAF